jgi:hypothetical protein
VFLLDVMSDPAILTSVPPVFLALSTLFTRFGGENAGNLATPIRQRQNGGGNNRFSS